MGPVLSAARTATAIMVAGLTSCSRPTEIRIDVSTDIACEAVGGTGTALTVTRGTSAPTTTITRECNAGKVGSFLVLPSDGTDEAVTVDVAAGTPSPERCLLGERPRGCILARRSTHFAPNASIHLPVDLSTACRDVACNDGETCADGACRSASIENPAACARDGLCALHTDSGAPDAKAPPPPSKLCDPSTTAATRVAQYQKSVGAIVADNARLFWTSVEGSGGRILALPLAGGSPLELVADRLLPVAITTDATNLYFTADLPETATVSRVALDGRTPPRELAPLSGASGLVVDATHIYWADSDEGTLSALSIVGEGRQSLVTDTPMARLVSDERFLYWTSGETIGRVAKTGGPPQLLTTVVGSGLADLAVDGTHIYWTATGKRGTESISRMPKDGSGAAEKLVTDQRQPSHLAIDDDAIYWTALSSTENTFGAIRKLAKKGGAVLSMQEHVSPPIAITVDATCVYWGNANGDVMAVRKNP